MTKQVYRLTADFKVTAEFDVIAESAEQAEELVASQSSDIHAKSVRYGIDVGNYNVDEGSVRVDDLGEATDADITRPDVVMAIQS